METVTLFEAKTQLSELVDRVAAGEAIDIVRHGKPVARLSPIPNPRQPIDIGRLQALTATMPAQTETSSDLVRSMRDGDRY